ncbi:phage tail tape measure protein, family [Clostridium perfringens]|uniref:Phage tail tape measure protein, family n=2 Tax=Clostridium perfringens TaxID=1502 RepID=A0A2X2YBJ2_CLOPF|nr:phage tail tape measure protein, family [Clostridium perfringens]
MKEMAQELKKVGSSYNLANTQAKLFGSRTDLLKSQQSELTAKMKIQNNMIKTQGEHLTKLNGDLDKQKSKQSELSKKIDDTTKKYKDSVEATGKNSKESKELSKELKMLKEEYSKNDRAIDSNISKLNNAEIKLNNSKKALEENKKALENINKELNKTKLDSFSDSCDKLGNKASKLGEKLTLGVTLPMGAAGVASFDLASDLNENINKTEVVFDENADVVKKWSENSLESMGICQSSALEMASKFGDMGSAMGLNSKQTMEYSMNLTKLAGDLASFKNISIERANEALTGVYTGETEALKSLGYVMTEENLKAYALASGFKKTEQNSVEAQKAAIGVEKAQNNLNKAIDKYGKNSIQAREANVNLASAQEKLNKATKGGKIELTQAEKVQLRYNYIMDQAKKAQGDYERTSDQAANASRKFKESTKALGATIGNNLLPIFTPWINKANEIIKVISSMSVGTQKLIVGFGLFAASVGPILKVSGSILKLTKSTIKGAKKVKEFAKATKEGTNIVGKFGKGVISGTKAVANFTKAIILNTASGVKNGAIWVGNKVKMLAYKTAQLAVTGATKAMTLAQKGLNIVMAMNPIVLVIGLLVALGATFVILYNKCEWFRNGVNNVWSSITSTFTKFDNFFTGIFTKDWTENLGLLGVPLNSFLGTVGAIWNGVKGIFNGILTFLHGVFTGNWEEIFQGLGDIVKSIFGTIGGVIKAPINAAISGINWVISKINTISFDVPSWIPGIGGSHFGINLPTIPALAEGGIVTKATMALVGEGKEHEAVIPLSKLDKLVTSSVKAVLNSYIIKKDKYTPTEGPKIFKIIVPVDSKVIAEVIVDSNGNVLTKKTKGRAIVRGGTAW